MRLLMTADDVAADRDRWHKLRLGDDQIGARVGGSEIADIMHLPGAHGSPWKVWMRKTGRWPDDDGETTDQMEFGNYCEPWSRRKLAEKYTDLHFCDGGLYCAEDRPWMIATFDLTTHEAAGCGAAWPPTPEWYHPERPGAGDGLTPAVPVDLTAPTGTVQQKNVVFSDWYELGVPYAYRAQALWEAAIAGVPMAYLAPFDRVSVVTELFEVPVDDQARRDIELMIEAAEGMRDLVRTDTPPPVDDHPATGLALRKRWSEVDPDKEAVVPWRLASRWRRAGQAKTRAARRQAGYGNQLVGRSQDAGRLLARDPATGELVHVATRRVGKRRAFTVAASDRVDTLSPNQKWTP